MAFASFSFNTAVSFFGVHLDIRACLVSLEWLAGCRLQAVDKEKQASVCVSENWN